MSLAANGEVVMVFGQVIRFFSFLVLLIPFTVSADLTGEVKIFASDGADYDQFGRAVSISGDTAAIGSNSGSTGAVYVLVRDAVSGDWAEQQKLTASDGASNDFFGRAVAMDGDTIVVGAEGASVSGSNTGAAYVFVRSGTVWTEQAKLIASDGSDDDKFGHAVAIDGDTVVIGAEYAQELGDGVHETNPPGAAYVFVRSGTTWSEQQKIRPDDSDYGDNFGNAVAIDGDTVVVGAKDKHARRGSAYIFVRSQDSWAQQQKLLASDNAVDDWFGHAVAVSGDTAMVSNNSYVHVALSNYVASSVYVFNRNGATWTEEQILNASDFDGTVNFPYDGFGESISIQGDQVLIGSYSTYDDNGSLAGSAYLYQIDLAGDWSEIQHLTASDGSGMDIYGGSVALGDEHAIIGAWREDYYDAQTGFITDLGAAYIYAQGAGVTSPEIVVTDSVAPIDDLQLLFGDVTELSFADHSITVTNSGDADLILGLVVDQNLLNNDFVIQADSCSGQTLAPLSNCALTIRFTPPSTGAFTDGFEIPSNDADESVVTVSAQGHGIGVPVPDITVVDSIAPPDDLQIAFGARTLATSGVQTVTISNVGDADLVIGNIGSVDVVALPFSLINDHCSGQTVIPASSCTFEVQFEPTSAGIFNDNLDIPSNDADEPSVIVTVTGTGVAQPVADIAVTDAVDPVDDLQLPFGRVAENSTATKQVDITNNGSADLVLGQIAVSNPLADPFQLDNDTCSAQTLSQGETCAITIRFSPTSVADFNDSLDIPSNDGDENPITLHVSGEGVVANTVDVGGNPDNDSDGGSSGAFAVEVLSAFLVWVFGLRRKSLFNRKFV